MHTSSVGAGDIDVEVARDWDSIDLLGGHLLHLSTYSLTWHSLMS
jgi:hypothetical protein